MIPISEVFAAGVADALRLAPALTGAPIGDSVQLAVSLRSTPVAIVVTLGDEMPDDLVGRTNWQTDLLVCAVTQGDASGRIAHQCLAMAHPIVMSYRHERLIGISLLTNKKPMYASEDGACCIRTAYYRIEYQTASNSLE